MNTTGTGAGHHHTQKGKIAHVVLTWSRALATRSDWAPAVRPSGLGEGARHESAPAASTLVLIAVGRLDDGELCGPDWDAMSMSA